jgi:putative exosortase-associated protein (TIGR04073 family)
MVHATSAAVVFAAIVTKSRWRWKKLRFFLARVRTNLLTVYFRMKNRIVLSIFSLLALCSVAVADIQSPPGHHYNWSHKLSRGIGNVLYGFTEPFNVWQRTNRSDGANAAFADFFVEGIKRTVVRAGYGVYEIATFPTPTWKNTYRPPYYRKEKIDPWWGYTEFSPDLGGGANADYSRTVSW